MRLSCLFIGYGLFFISDRFEFFPFATVFKPLDIICDEVFPYGYGIGGFLCPALVLFCFSAYVFQQTLTVKTIPDFLISLFLVAFECKTIISMCFLYNHPCSFLLGIHGIRSNDAFSAAKSLQDCLHFRNFIRFPVNSRAGQTDAPFCGHDIKFIQVTQVFQLFCVFLCGMPSLFSIRSNDVTDITVQFFVFIYIVI